MTSSSDTDKTVHRRRLFIRNLPSPCPTDSLKSFFRTFGHLSGVHALRNADFALITFEEEEEAQRAQRAAHGLCWRGSKIRVEFAPANHAPPIPLTGARRQVLFPRPFGGAANRGRPNAPAGPETYQHPHRGQRQQASDAASAASSAATTGSARGSRSARARGGLHQVN